MHKSGLFALWVVLAGLCLAQTAPDVGRSPSETRRDSEWKTAEIFRKAAVRPGARIADIGSGDGFLTIPLAAAVGPAGQVFAVDIDDRVLGELRTRVRNLDLKNVEVVRGTERDPQLAANSLDAAILLRSYHEFTYYGEMLTRIRAALRPGGRLVIADVGPAGGGRDASREEQVRRHVLESRMVERDLTEAGFRILELSDAFAKLNNGERVWLILAERLGPS